MRRASKQMKWLSFPCESFCEPVFFRRKRQMSPFKNKYHKIESLIFSMILCLKKRLNWKNLYRVKVNKKDRVANFFTIEILSIEKEEILRNSFVFFN